MKLTVESLSFSYPDGPPVFENISFSLAEGEVLAILGSNGTGKSTLLNCVANQALPSRGQILIDGIPTREMTAVQLAQRLAYVPQMHHPMFAYRVLDVVVMGRIAYLGALRGPGSEDYDLAMEMLELMGVAALSEKSYLEISGGERQLVLFAQALTQQPRFLVLDEPTSHLDFGNQIRCLEVIQSMAEQGIGILLSTHFPDHSLMFRHKVCVLHEGRIMATGPAEQVIIQENMERIYRIPIQVTKDVATGRMVCLPQKGDSKR